MTDIDGDGTDELLLTKSTDSVWPRQIAIASLQGDILWEGPKGNWELQTTEDLDGDGIQELLAVQGVPWRTVAVFGVVP